MANTITIPFDTGSETFDRDQLATAALLWLEHDGDRQAVRAALVDDHGINPANAIYLTVAARICVEHGIEP